MVLLLTFFLWVSSLTEDLNFDTCLGEGRVGRKECMQQIARVIHCSRILDVAQLVSAATAHRLSILTHTVTIASQGKLEILMFARSNNVRRAMDTLHAQSTCTLAAAHAAGEAGE